MDQENENGADIKGIFSNYGKMWEDFFLHSASPDMMKDILSAHLNFYKSHDAVKDSPAEKEIMDRLSTGLRFYSSMLNWWTEILANPFKSFPSNQERKPVYPVPDNIMKFLETYSSSFMQWVELYLKYLREAGKPDSIEIKSRINKHIDALLQIYEDGIGKFIKMPAVGPSRYAMEKGKNWLDSAIKYQIVLMDFFQNIIQPLIQVSSRILDTAKATIEDEPTEESMQKLYFMLLDEGEKAYNQFFKSKQYLATMQMTMDAYLEFQSNYEKMIVEMLKGTPIVTKPDIEDVYRELHEHRKKIRELDKKISHKEKKGKEGK